MGEVKRYSAVVDFVSRSERRMVVLSGDHDAKVFALEAENAAIASVADEAHAQMLEAFAERDDLEAENAKLRAELERRVVPDADIFWREKLAIKFCEARGILEGSKERASVVDAFISALSLAPSAPKADLVKVQLLEALENVATWIEQLPVPTVGAAGQLVKIDKAIAAARKGEGE